MWNKKEGSDDVSADATDSESEDRPSDRAGPANPDEAIIGNSIRIQGEVTGDEDLTIQGHVDGSVNLDQHAVTVGPDGEVHADIVARVITVDGKVNGDLTADEQIVVRSSAHVEGDISAPRVVLEDGAHFRGGVDMDEASSRAGSSSRSGSASTRGRSGSRLSASGSGDEDSQEERASGGDDGDEDD